MAPPSRHGRARCPPHILICLIILCSSLFVPLAWGKAVKDYGSLLPPGAGQQTPLTKMGLARLFGFGFLSRPGAPTPSPKGVAAAAARALEAGMLGKKDAILYWNQVALDAVAASFATGEQPGPCLSSRALAIVHLAMYDAYAGAGGGAVEGLSFKKGGGGRLPPYLPDLDPAPAGAVPAAAVAGAAFQTLVALYPSQAGGFRLALHAFFKARPDLAVQALAKGSGGGLDFSDGGAGAAWGAYVGHAVLRQRAADPVGNMTIPDASFTPPSPASVFPPPYKPSPTTPDAGLYGAYYGSGSALFSTTSRYTLQPPALDAAAYAAHVDVLWAKGTVAAQFPDQPPAIVPHRRTAVENDTGIYWGYDGQRYLGTPPRLYNQFVRAVAAEHKNSEADNARLFAFVNAAMGDAGILAWENKYKYFIARPATAMRGAASTAGTVPAGWLPLGSQVTNTISQGLRSFTPNFPAYPSGHATFGSAAFQITRLFYGHQPGSFATETRTRQDAVFKGLFVSDELDGISFNALGQTRPLVVRSYLKGGLWGAIMDDALSRVFLGVHWVFDCYATADPISPANVGTAPPDMDAFVGGVPLGTSIAENIFAVNGIAPAFTGTPAPQDPFEAAVAPASAAQGLGSEAVPTSTFHGVVDTFL